MASDADYASFLDKANQDTGASATTQSSSSKKFSTKSVNTTVPVELEEIQEYYTSDADEPFEPVSLEWEGGWKITASELKSLLNHDSNIEEADEKLFSQYKKVVEVVKEAGNGKVAYFRVEHGGGTRLEYYVVSVDENGGRVVGVKALAVES